MDVNLKSAEAAKEGVSGSAGTRGGGSAGSTGKEMWIADQDGTQVQLKCNSTKSFH